MYVHPIFDSLLILIRCFVIITRIVVRAGLAKLFLIDRFQIIMMDMVFNLIGEILVMAPVSVTSTV